jgi:hypothetical protein
MLRAFRENFAAACGFAFLASLVVGLVAKDRIHAAWVSGEYHGPLVRVPSLGQSGVDAPATWGTIYNAAQVGGELFGLLTAFFVIKQRWKDRNGNSS